MNVPRCRRLVGEAVENLDLDLSGRTVLTEAATGPFALTPFLAASAEADSVLALTRDSRWGTVDDVRARTDDLAEAWDIDTVEVIADREDPRVSAADIVTNLGFVRPVDEDLLSRMERPVVALMHEAWEHRPEDVDLDACRRLGVPVAGTDESDPRIDTMTYVGHLAVQLLHEVDVEVHRSAVVVLGGGPFAESVEEVLAAAGADVTTIEGPLSKDDLAPFERADALVVAEHRHHDPLLGPDADVAAAELATVNPGLTVVHISGHVDAEDLRASGLVVAPDRIAPPGSMSRTTAALGPKPLVDLHAGGLRVGQALAEARGRGMDGKQAVQAAAEVCSLAQPLEDRGDPP